MAANSNLHKAKSAKDDEFYTQLTDIEKELRHYKNQLRGKVVLCNCDDPEESNFWQFFSLNFEAYGLKKLIATHYDAGQPTYKLELSRDTNGDGRVDGLDTVRTSLSQNGDFRSPECVALLDEADVVITNPPFSLFRQYVAQLVEHKEKFLVIGSKSAITYKEIFNLIQTDQMWLGKHPMSRDMFFDVSDDRAKELRETKKEGSAYRIVNDRVCARAPTVWYTNFDVSKRHEEAVLYRTYNPADYPSYDNFDAIEVAKAVEIPGDYDGVMGVPLTFLDKCKPGQFEIVGITTSSGGQHSKRYPKQVQVSADGTTRTVGKLNDAPAMKVSEPPAGKTYYKVDGELFVLRYHRILVRKRQL